MNHYLIFKEFIDIGDFSTYMYSLIATKFRYYFTWISRHWIKEIPILYNEVQRAFNNVILLTHGREKTKS